MTKLTDDEKDKQVQNIIHIKNKTKKHKSHHNLGLISGSPEG